jgi:hypothetical protein
MTSPLNADPRQVGRAIEDLAVEAWPLAPGSGEKLLPSFEAAPMLFVATNAPPGKFPDQSLVHAG